MNEEIEEDVSGYEADLRGAFKKKEELEVAISQLKRNQEEIRKQIDNHVAVLNGTIGVINYLNSKLEPKRMLSLEK